MKIASVADVKAKFSGYWKASEKGPKGLKHEEFWQEVETEASKSG